MRFSNIPDSGVAKGGTSMYGPPILQTKHKHTFKLHEIGQFGQFKITKIVATVSHFKKLKCTKFYFGS